MIQKPWMQKIFLNSKCLYKFFAVSKHKRRNTILNKKYGSEVFVTGKNTKLQIILYNRKSGHQKASTQLELTLVWFFYTNFCFILSFLHGEKHGTNRQRSIQTSTNGVANKAIEEETLAKDIGLFRDSEIWFSQFC